MHPVYACMYMYKVRKTRADYKAIKWCICTVEVKCLDTGSNRSVAHLRVAQDCTKHLLWLLAIQVSLGEDACNVRLVHGVG